MAAAPRQTTGRLCQAVPANATEVADPFNLRRYTKHQAVCFDKALGEIRRGRKSSCWMWYVIPTPPFVKDGVELGSAKNRHYSLRGEGEARAYLAFEADGVSLRRNYLEILAAVRDQLVGGVSAAALMGVLDAPKLVSSVLLFERLSRVVCDDELHTVCREVLQLLGTEPSADSQPLLPGNGPRRRTRVAAQSAPRLQAGFGASRFCPGTARSPQNTSGTSLMRGPSPRAKPAAATLARGQQHPWQAPRAGGPAHPAPRTNS